MCHVDQAPVQFPTARVFRLPDMVIFSHARHAKAGCNACHGDVNLHLTKTMKACVDCHKKGGATTVCLKCHELGQ